MNPNTPVDRSARGARSRNPLLRALANALRLLAGAIKVVVLIGLVGLARALGGHPQIPDPMKRNQITMTTDKE